MERNVSRQHVLDYLHTDAYYRYHNRHNWESEVALGSMEEVYRHVKNYLKDFSEAQMSQIRAGVMYNIYMREKEDVKEYLSEKYAYAIEVDSYINSCLTSSEMEAIKNILISEFEKKLYYRK
jgi:hypothetical protein